MWFASYLYSKGLITGDEFADAAREQMSRRPILGQLAIKDGYLSINQVAKILYRQADDLQKPFGQLAVSMGFLDEKKLVHLLNMQYHSCPPMAEILVELGAISHAQMVEQLHLARQVSGNLEVNYNLQHELPLTYSP